MLFSNISSRYQWYFKKRFFIPIFLLTLVLIVAVILGSVLGSRSTATTTGMHFGVIVNSKVDDSSYYKPFL
jgi:4-hydroxybenzoate polyprenyltransferase